MTRAVRHTSRAAYARLVTGGALGRMQREAYAALYRHGPLTGAELDARLRGERARYHKRLSELERMGVVARGPTRRCRVTGQPAEEWDVTPRRVPRSVPVRAPLPSPAALAAALRFATGLAAAAAARGEAVPPEFDAAVAWLRSRGRRRRAPTPTPRAAVSR